MKNDRNKRTDESRERGAHDRLVPASAKDDELVERKHRQIAQGAARLFFEKGFHRATIREIAVSCGMSMGQLYHYISSKDDVLYLVYEQMQRQWLQHLSELGIDKMEQPRKRLRQALRATLSYIIEHKELFLFIYTETKYLGKSHLKAVLNMDAQNVVGFWRKLLDEAGLGSQASCNTDFTANLISFLMVFLVLRGWNLKEAGSEENIEALMNFIMRGLGATEP